MLFEITIQVLVSLHGVHGSCMIGAYKVSKQFDCLVMAEIKYNQLHEPIWVSRIINWFLFHLEWKTFYEHNRQNFYQGSVPFFLSIIIYGKFSQGSGFFHFYLHSTVNYLQIGIYKGYSFVLNILYGFCSIIVLGQWNFRQFEVIVNCYDDISKLMGIWQVQLYKAFYTKKKVVMITIGSAL